jgi:cobalt-zinc-cadmium resistance protein CzcA
VHGTTVPLKEIATIREVTGPLLIFRDASARFIAVKFSIRGRDMGSTIAEAQQRVNAAVSLPRGLRLVWTGDFENQQRAQATLSWAIPVSLVAIVLILLSTARHARDAFLIMMNVPFALIGGVAGLYITGTNFSISAGIGFIALGGICILNGVLLVSAFHSNLAIKGISLADAIRTGVEGRIRPIVMTACMGALGLLPAAMSTGIGSDAQRPLAIVVVSGFVTATVLSLLIFPQLFYVAYRKRRRVA